MMIKGNCKTHKQKRRNAEMQKCRNTVKCRKAVNFVRNTVKLNGYIIHFYVYTKAHTAHALSACRLEACNLIG